MTEIKKKYDELQKKYKLPAYKEINAEFEISTIDKEDFLLSEIRKKTDEKIDLFIKIIERIIQPDACISDMREERMFNDKDKNELFISYKYLQRTHKSSLLLAIDEDERENAEFLNELWKEWQPIKKKMVKTVEKTKNSWNGDLTFEDEVSYLG